MIKRRVLFIILITVFLFNSLAFAQNTDFGRTELKNGIVLITKNVPSSEIVSFSIILKLSVYDEEAYTPGIRSFIAELIKYALLDVRTPENTRLFELLGVSLKTSAEPDFISVDVTCKAEDFGKISDIVSKVVINPGLDSKKYDECRKKFVELRRQSNGVIDSVYSLFISEFYKYHPYKLINQYSLLTIEKMDQDKIKRFIGTTFSADRIIMAVSGNFSTQKLLAILNKNWGDVEKRNTTVTSLQWEPKASEKQLFLSALSNMGWLVIGYRFPSYSSPDYPAMMVAKNIVAEGFCSRFWIELREKRGFAYELGAVAPALEGPAHVMFFVVLQPKNAMEARKIALDIIADIKANGVSESELSVGKEKLLGSFLLGREYSEDFTHETASAQAIGGDYSIDALLKQKINAVTADDVKNVCNKYFVDPTVIIVRPPGIYFKDTYI